MQALRNPIDISDYTWNERLKYYEKLELADGVDSEDEEHDRSGQRKRKRGHNKRNSNRGNKSENIDNDRPKKKPKGDKKRTEACKHCGKFHLAADNECLTLDKNKDKKPKPKANKPKSEHAYFSAEHVSRLIAVLPIMNQGARSATWKVTRMASPVASVAAISPLLVKRIASTLSMHTSHAP